MPSQGVKGARERDKKSASGTDEKGMKGRTTEPPKAGWALTQERLAAMIPTQRRRYLLFGDMLDDTGASTSIFPRESVEVSYCMPDPRTWTQALEPAAVRQNRLLGVLKAAEARGRIRAMRLRYTRMRAEEITLLIRSQGSARAAIRLELFLPPQLKPTKIPDPLDRQEVPENPETGGRARISPHIDPSPFSPQRRRVETILEEAVDGLMVDGGIFSR